MERKIGARDRRIEREREIWERKIVERQRMGDRKGEVGRNGVKEK